MWFCSGRVLTGTNAIKIYQTSKVRWRYEAFVLPVFTIWQRVSLSTSFSKFQSFLLKFLTADFANELCFHGNIFVRYCRLKSLDFHPSKLALLLLMLKIGSQKEEHLMSPLKQKSNTKRSFLHGYIVCPRQKDRSWKQFCRQFLNQIGIFRLQMAWFLLC